MKVGICIDPWKLPIFKQRLIGGGFKYDLSENYHLLGYIAPAIQNASATNRYVWYGSVLWTF